MTWNSGKRHGEYILISGSVWSQIRRHGIRHGFLLHFLNVQEAPSTETSATSFMQWQDGIHKLMVCGSSVPSELSVGRLNIFETPIHGRDQVSENYWESIDKLNHHTIWFDQRSPIFHRYLFRRPLNATRSIQHSWSNIWVHICLLQKRYNNAHTDLSKGFQDLESTRY